MRQDRTADAVLAAAWRERLSAPAKTTVRLESSARLPAIEERGHPFIALLRHARLLRRGAAVDGRPRRPGHAQTWRGQPGFRCNRVGR
ncbi:hypothetical protein XFF6166_60043 [Xanthomonas citri pv. fuscans]|nr:hypothetical protein XFF4834R_chr17170 [Xanthomonas citri pv. fuscans]SON83666.1 hypothetical protein XFF6166_60043 [Xanthomonas citri pv. fuscans]SOO00022.1 hypothetical protein XFF6960_220065 [Xanthomonas citri pv. fuscans]SOO04501.1 hypothetical protein XFF7767_250042 [Xanthomonas citri pv. fuscans]SOO07902.1 hypothetical protein XFF6970_120040 [Xanthomonas citri pv. fuscans]